MAWFKYVWVVLLAIWYFIWTYVAWTEEDEEWRIRWIIIHIIIIFSASFIYFLIME